MRKKLLILSIITFNSFWLMGQNDTVHLSLNKVIILAQDSSLSAFRNQYTYEIQYWNYRYYQARQLPSLNLTTTPVAYYRYISKQFNALDTSYSFYEEQNLNSYFNLNLQQYITKTGGTIYAESDLNRLVNFSGSKTTSYSSTPIKVGLNQPIFGFNSFKWEKRIEPLIYRKAKLEYIQSAEDIAIEAITNYFTLVTAEQNLKIAKTNFANADTLYQIGQKRLDILAIDKADLLTLKLDWINAENSLKDAINSYDKAITNLNIYLRLPQSTSYKVIIPDSITLEHVDAFLAMDKVKKGNPFYLSVQQQVMEAERDVEKSKINSRFNSNLGLSFGLNQQSKNLSGAYKDPVNQQIVNFSLNIPILDWGQRKGVYNLAKSQQKLQLASLQQSEIDFEEDVRITMNEFNLQKSLVKSAKEAAEVAVEVYEMNKKRFLLGKIDVNTLSYQLSRKESAVLGYISALQKYWQMYYKVRKLTMFDFENNTSLDKELENKL